MVTGLYDEEIQCEVLSNDRNPTTFRSKFEYIEGLEKGRKAKGELHKETSHVNVVKSQYRRQRNQSKIKNFTKSNDVCCGCGSTNHTSAERQVKCPAWGKACTFCGVNNHFRKVCRKNIGEANNEVSRNATFQNVSQQRDSGEDDISYFLSIGHLIWNGNKFVSSKPSSLPTRRVQIRVVAEQHRRKDVD